MGGEGRNTGSRKKINVMKATCKSGWERKWLKKGGIGGFKWEKRLK